jgi:hypothetical protein
MVMVSDNTGWINGNEKRISERIRILIIYLSVNYLGNYMNSVKKSVHI